MRKTLEDLYFGNITPHQKRTADNSELQRMVNRAVECESELMAALDDKGKHALEVLMSAQHEIEGITAVENFILGFRLGVRLMVECMDDDGNTLCANAGDS